VSPNNRNHNEDNMPFNSSFACENKSVFEDDTWKIDETKSHSSSSSSKTNHQFNPFFQMFYENLGNFIIYCTFY
jgi:hypothetical protein